MRSVLTKEEIVKKIIFNLIVLLIVVIRLVSVLYVPDVFCDEGDILLHIQSIMKCHMDTQGKMYPLFSKVGAGLTTYTYIYPMVILCKIFGISSIKARIYQQILTILSCFISAKGIKNLTNDNELSRIIFVISLTLPWGFVQANRIWDPAFVPIYFSIHFFFFSLYYKRKEINKTGKVIDNILLMITFGSLVFLAVVYPPCRIPAVAMWIYILVWLIRKKSISVPQVVMIIILCTILSAPLAINLLDPNFNSRAVNLLVFRKGKSFMESIILWVGNFAELIGPRFLFVIGDSNYRHAVPILGMLGTLSIVPVIKELRTSMGKVCKYMLFIITMTFISVALTKDGMPHALRSCLAWMPFSILIGYGWKDLVCGKTRKIQILSQVSVIAFFALYVLVYIDFYSSM